MALLQVPAHTVALLRGVTEDPLLTLLLINAALLLLGTFMDMAPMIMIGTPIFLPVVKAMGMDPVHFGVVLILNLGIGTITPPVGPVLFVACAVGKVSMWEATKTSAPFYAACFAVLMLVTYVPALSLWLPSLSADGGPRCAIAPARGFGRHGGLLCRRERLARERVRARPVSAASRPTRSRSPSGRAEAQARPARPVGRARAASAAALKRRCRPAAGPPGGHPNLRRTGPGTPPSLPPAVSRGRAAAAPPPRVGRPEPAGPKRRASASRRGNG